MYNSPYFTLEELCSNKNAKASGLKNFPDFYQAHNLSRLCELVLDPIRKQLGFPIYVYSGFRSQQVNAKVGGVVASAHVFGCAADIYCDDMQALEIAIRQNAEWDVLIKETNDNGKALWFHITVPLEDTPPRRKYLKR